MSDPEIDVELIDDAVLAPMFLTLHKGWNWEPWRAWRSFNWEVLGRLHENDLVLDPVGRAKSVVLPEEGHRQCEEAYHRLFAKRADQAPAGS